jgi:ketosteroid isomerase-like protein
MSEETRAAVHAMYDAYRKGDGEKIAGIIDDDVDWIIYAPSEAFSFAGARRGKPAVLEALGSIAKEYALERHEPQVVIVDGDRAAVMSDVAFTQRATGRLLRMRVANFLRFRDGKLIEFREFNDTFDAVEQALGRWLDIGLPRAT